ncbi:diguanylate cyclase [Paenibacillus turpanensis]|uniref:diguanylate cyclase n=1 Tax=Paenibacillus turpanensis TaxID=2689078 RepID=UPI001408E645|nr:diguanylate cyclase [Paenibacillus turpanensis]
MRLTSKLQTKIILMLVTILIVILGANNGIIKHLFDRQYSEALKAHLILNGESLRNQLERIQGLGISAYDLVGFDEQCRELVEKNSDLSLVLVTNLTGNVLFSSDEQYKRMTIIQSDLASAVQQAKEGIFEYTLQNEHYIAAVVPFLDQNRINKAGAVIVSVESSKIHQKVSKLILYPTILTILFGIIALLLIMIPFSRWVTRPLHGMVERMNEVAAGNMRSLVQISSNDEVGQLGQAFNHMVGQIDELLERTARTTELESHFLLEQKQRQLSEKLREVSYSVSSTLDEYQVVERSIAACKQLLPYEAVALWMLSDDHPPRRFPEQGRVPIDDKFSHAELKSVIVQLRTEERPITRVHSDGLYLFVPILVKRKLIAMFMILSMEGSFTTSEVSLAFTHASQVGISMENARLYRQMREIAALDGLTGIFNRRHFFEAGAQIFTDCIREGIPLGLILFDIDHFKSVNDKYGHPVGDKVLKEVAEGTLEVLRDVEQAIFGRYGGEEFVVLLPGLEGEEAAVLTENIRRRIEALEFSTSLGRLRVTASLGIAILAPDTPTLDELLKKGDKALYKAKADGRNRVFMSPAYE